MDSIRATLDRLIEAAPSEGARDRLWDVAIAVDTFVARVDELERQVESLRIDMTSLARRVERVDGASGR